MQCSIAIFDPLNAGIGRFTLLLKPDIKKPSKLQSPGKGSQRMIRMAPWLPVVHLEQIAPLKGRRTRPVAQIGRYFDTNGLAYSASDSLNFQILIFFVSGLLKIIFCHMSCYEAHLI